MKTPPIPGFTLIVPADRKTILGIEKAANADAVLTGLSNVELDEKLTAAVLKLNVSMPLVAALAAAAGTASC